MTDTLIPQNALFKGGARDGNAGTQGFRKEFKIEAARRSDDPNRTTAEAARELGISANQSEGIVIRKDIRSRNALVTSLTAEPSPGQGRFRPRGR